MTGPASIMLVEDNPSDVELIATAFEEEGIAARFAVFADGEAAIAGLSAAADAPPRLVLLDLNLPRLSGYEVLVRLRGDPRFARVPAVVFSTSNHPLDRKRCLAAGADDYLVKPPHFQGLLDLVRGLHRRWLADAPKRTPTPPAAAARPPAPAAGGGA